MAKIKKGSDARKSTKKNLALQVDAEIQAIRARVQRRREYLDLLETELTNTRAIIQEFTELYNQRIGPLESEHHRLSRLLEQWSEELAPPPNGWQGQGKRAQRQGNPNRHHGDEHQERIEREKRSRHPDPNYERKVRELFRRLAKQYHPDVAQMEGDKKEREKIMAEINQAYMAKDLEALQALEHIHGLPKSGSRARRPGAELARLKLELRQLDAMIFEIEQTIRELDLSPAMQMRGESNDGRPHRRDVLREMEADYRARINDLREQLEGLGLEIDKDAT